MWNKNLARQLKTAQCKWLDSSYASRANRLKEATRTRMVVPSFLVWCKENGYAKLATAFSLQYEKSHKQTPMGRVNVFVENLIACNMCELCGTYAIASKASRICGVCRKTKEGQAFAHAKAAALTQATYTLNKADIDAKRIQTCMERYGAATPWQNTETYKEIAKKKKATCMKRYGFEHPLSNPVIALRQQQKAGSIKEIVLDGKLYHYQGYEDYALKKLVADFGAASVIGQYELEFPPLYLKAPVAFRPDIYCTALAAYIEVKSAYTLMQPWSIDTNRQKARLAKMDGFKVLWFVVNQKKTQARKLPELWYKWGDRKLALFLEGF